MSVSAVSSVDKRNQTFPSADSPAGHLVSVQWGPKNGHFEYFLTQNIPKTGTFDQSSPLKSTICIKKTTPTERIRHLKELALRIPAGHRKELALRITKELALRITEFVKDKIFRVIYYIPLVGRITENYFKEQAKNNYDHNLHLARSFYDRLIECVENSDVKRATICAGLVKSCAEKFAKIAAAIPKDDKKFAEKVDLEVEGAWALVAAAQEAVDKFDRVYSGDDTQS